MRKETRKSNLVEPVDVDKIEIRRDQYFANAYVVDFPLDSTPDHIWQYLFEREWKSSRHLWERKMFVVGNKLRLVTSINKFEEKIDWVKKVVIRTNLGIEKYNQETKAREIEISQLEETLTRQIIEEEKSEIEMIRSMLRKRFRAL